jgi:hypothetical protein
VDACADHAIVVAEETTDRAGWRAAEDGWWAFFGEGGEVGRSGRCAGADKGGEAVVSDKALATL